MKTSDVLVIGAGLTGLFTARNLSRYDLSVTVLEKENDVCTGISKANTGIIYTGYDNKPGSQKSKLCVQANEDFDRLCRDLSVRFTRPGSLMVSYGPNADRVLRKKYADGIEGGVKNLSLLSGPEAEAMEPNLKKGITLGLFARDTGTVNPWELGIAAYENARENGVSFRFREKVTGITRDGDAFIVETEKETYRARALVNAAGLSSDTVRELLEKPSVRIFPTAADYILLDRTEGGFVKHIIFHESESGKGLTLVPTVDGNLMAGPTTRELSAEEECVRDLRVTISGLSELQELCQEVVPDLDLSTQIRTFGALRPNPYPVHEENGRMIREEKSLKGFILSEEEGFFSLIGIKTPGLTFSNELGKVVSEKCAAWLGKEKALNERFTPVRKAPVRVSEMSLSERASLIGKDPAYGHVICRCMEVTEGEIRDALGRLPGGQSFLAVPAGDVSGVQVQEGRSNEIALCEKELLEQLKRRTGVFMGTCQGGRCTGRILKLLTESHDK